MVKQKHNNATENVTILFEEEIFGKFRQIDLIEMENDIRPHEQRPW